MDGDTIGDDVTMGDASATLLANRYRVVRQLGQGGMGSVWLAEDAQLDNRSVAIKMLPSVLVANTRAYLQLKAEALVSLKLTHPNIATVRAFEENAGNPFLVIDYIDGQTLDDYLADLGKLEEDEMIRILSPIAAALDYAHGMGVVHRDVKPGNVMIARDGTPFVLDFGIAREIQETMTRVTGKLSSGTLLYMSPEQLRGASPKAAQDVYSFAAMAYECLTGAPPFARGQVEYQILNELPEPLDPRFAKCGSGIMAGLAKNPSMRPTSCAKVLSGRKVSPPHRVSDSPCRVPGRTMEHAQRRHVDSRLPQRALPSLRHPTKRMVACLAAAMGVLLIIGGVTHSYVVRRTERLARAAARSSMERASQVVEQVREVSSENGFAVRIAAVERAYDDAEDRFRGRNFTRAKTLFDEMTSAGRQVLELDAERCRCLSLYREAKDARSRGAGASARQEASQLWKCAEKDLAEGRRQQEDERFVAASMLFAKAKQEFNDAYEEAVRVRREREKTERERQNRAGETAIADIRREAGLRLAECRKLRGDLTNRVMMCEAAYDEAERMKAKNAWAEAAKGYTNVVEDCRNALRENERRRKVNDERKAKAKREKELDRKRAERERQRREDELEAYRRKHYPECYEAGSVKKLASSTALPRTADDCADRLAGSWSCRHTVTCITDGTRLPPNPPIDETFVFHSNGSLSYTYDSNNKYVGSSTKNGTWTLSGEMLHIVVEGARIDYKIIWKHGDSFELRYANLDQYIGKSKSLMPSVSSLRARYDAAGNLVKTGKFSGFLGIGGGESTWIESPKVFTRR